MTMVKHTEMTVVVLRGAVETTLLAADTKNRPSLSYDACC